MVARKETMLRTAAKAIAMQVPAVAKLARARDDLLRQVSDLKAQAARRDLTMAGLVRERDDLLRAMAGLRAGFPAADPPGLLDEYGSRAGLVEDGGHDEAAVNLVKDGITASVDAPDFLRVTEQATDDNFNPAGYLGANKDLRERFGGDELAALQHFRKHGRAGGRRQLTREFLRCQDAYRLRKFALFHRALIDNSVSAFPAFLGAHFHDQSQYEGESANATPGFFADEITTNPNKLYADIGAGLRDAVYFNCVYLEVYPAVTADIVTAPSCELPFRTGSLDGIGCFAVLEHVKEPWRLASEFSRVLKPGGKIFIDWPFLQPVHGFPSHYYNATREGLKEMFAPDFEITELYTGRWQWPSYTVYWVLNALLEAIGDPAMTTRVGKLSVRYLATLTPQCSEWERVISTMSDNAVSKLSCGNTLIGRKLDKRAV